jgi:hypothetical protein
MLYLMSKELRSMVGHRYEFYFFELMTSQGMRTYHLNEQPASFAIASTECLGEIINYKNNKRCKTSLRC